LLIKFCREGGGCITSFEDAALPPIHRLVGEDDNVEIVPFGTLVRRTLEATGQEAGQIATQPQLVAAIDEAAKKMEDDSPLRQSLRFAGNREALGELFGELDDWEIDLDSIAQSEEASPSLGLKLEQISRVKTLTENLLNGLGRDRASGQLKDCLENVLEPDLRLPRLLVTVGEEAPPAKLRWIRWMTDQGCDVTLVCPRHATEPALFEDSNRIGEELEVEEEWIGSGNLLSNNLFATGLTPAVAPKATILIAANPISECEWIMRKITEEGEEDVAIFARDAETYFPLIQATAESLGVSICIQRRTDLLQNGLARLTLKCIEACGSDDVRGFLPLLKRSYLSPHKEIRLQIEQSIALARSHGNLDQWEVLAEAAASLPEHAIWFLKALEWRTSAREESRSLTAWVTKLRELGGIILSASDSGKGSEEYDSERDSRAAHVMQSSVLTVAQLESITAQSRYSIRQFAIKCRQLWTEADVSIPSADSGVPVVSSVWAIPAVKKILILGMIEGVFPRRRRENAILNDSERQSLSSLARLARPLRTSLDAARADREAFYTLCSSASEEIHFSYPATEDDRDNIPTFYLQRVKEALGNVVTLDRSTNPLSFDLNDNLEERAEASPQRIEIPSLAQSRDTPVSARALQDAVTCPFKFQVRHNLKLFSNAKTVAWHNLRLLPIKANLYSANDPASAEAALVEELKRQIDDLSQELSDWEIRLLTGGGERLIGEWVRREFCARAIWPRSNETFGSRALGGDGIREMMPGDVRVTTRVAGISHLNQATKVLHLFDTTTPEGSDMRPMDQFYYGLYLLAGYESGLETGLEVDGMDGGRVLLVFDRAPFPMLRSNSDHRLKVIDLSGGEDPKRAKPQFFREVRKTLAEAVQIRESGQIQPVSGEHCKICEYGELCRQSSVFSDRAQDDPGDL
jgi:hypothetical protein